MPPPIDPSTTREMRAAAEIGRVLREAATALALAVAVFARRPGNRLPSATPLTCIDAIAETARDLGKDMTAAEVIAEAVNDG